MSDIFLNGLSRSTGRVLDVPYQPTTSTSPTSNLVETVSDRTSYTLTSSSSGSTVIIDNRIGNSGMTILYVDTSSQPGMKWNVYVLYGTNGSITNRPRPYTSVVATYGVNSQTIDVIQNIADFQSILIVPNTSDVTLTEGNIDINPNDRRLISIPNKYVFLSTVTATDVVSPPDANDVASGTPTLTNYGIALSDIEVIYMGIGTSGNPTFMYNVSNTYYPILDQ